MKKFFVFLLFLILSACQTSTGPRIVTPHGNVISLEIAKTALELETGLMNRTSLPKNHGMLFVFESPRVLYFWMKNTLIPLDILFLDERGVIVDKITMPSCEKDPCPTYQSKSPALYALEIAKGEADRMKLQASDILQLYLSPE